MKTVFIRAIEAGIDEKASLLRSCVQPGHLNRFLANPLSFSNVPCSPFGYWTSDRIRDLFTSFSPLESDGRAARRTNGTTDDSRWIRAFWEVNIAHASYGYRWVLHLKGGEFSPYYSDPHLMISWDPTTRSYPGYLGTIHRPDVRPASLQYFFRPGITWSRRSQKGLSLRAMPAGCIFGDKGPGIFLVEDNSRELCAMLAITNSTVFRYLVAIQMAFGSYEAGVIQRTPYPRTDEHELVALCDLAKASW